MSKSIILVDEAFEFRTEASKKGKKISLFRSNSEIWTNPNEKVSSLFDNGNGVIIGHEDLGALELNYSAAAELYHTLNCYFKGDGKPGGKIKVIKNA